MADDSTYRPDFFDRNASTLRCRPCGASFAFGGHTGRDPGWLTDHVGERFACPNCGLDSRIPTIEESEWPKKKDHDDPQRGVATTKRARR